MTKTLVIAEAGVNHNGDISLAKEMISAAAEAGADLVKFQTFKTTQLVTKLAQKANYQRQFGSGTEYQNEMLSKLELSRENHFELIQHCNIHGIGFFSTAFDLDSLNFLHQLKFDLFKIPSGEITNFPYLQKVASFGKDLIISTGMSTLLEVERAINVLESGGLKRHQLTVLHCTSAYPTSVDQVNLHAMKNMEREFDVKIGYSDHTTGIEVAIAAVALGACVIEKHFTLDRNLAGPDHKASLLPQELSSMVSAIRNIEVALGDGNKIPTSAEMDNLATIRKSIVAAEPIKKGEIFSETNLTTKRPGDGISPMSWESFIGKLADRDYETDEKICQ